LVAETGLEARDVVLAVVVVLVDDPDLRVRAVMGDRLPVELALELVGGLPASRPGVLLPVRAPRRRTGRNEHLRDLLRVQVRPDREVDLGTERADDREHVVLLHETAREL